MQSDRFKVGYSEQNVTPLGGLSLVYNFCKSSGLFPAIRSWSLPMPKSIRGYDPSQIIEQILCSIWSAASNYIQLDLTRLDSVVSKTFGWDKIGEYKSVEMFLCLFGQKSSTELIGTKVALLRAYSSFWTTQTFKHSRECGIFYIISTKITQRLQCHMVENIKQWVVIDDRILCAEMQYQSQGWAQAERIVIVPQRSLTDSEECAGKQLALFKDDPYQNQWRYSMMTTNLEFRPLDVWSMYRGRDGSKNRIKELEEDDSLDSFVVKDFWATDTDLSICTLTNDIINTFRHLVLRVTRRSTLKTIQHLFLNIAAIWQYDKLTPEKMTFLRKVLPQKRRKWFESLCYRSLGNTPANPANGKWGFKEDRHDYVFRQNLLSMTVAFEFSKD